eukprot:5029546-Alexandrium_andersonii.AAC.1
MSATALLFIACTREEAKPELRGSSLHAPPRSSVARSLAPLAEPRQRREAAGGGAAPRREDAL